MIMLAEAAAWWAVLIGIWMITVSPPDWPDVWVAAGAALLCTILTIAARRALKDRWRPGRETWRWPAALPAAAVVDTVRVLMLPLRDTRRHPRKGDLETVRLADGGPEQRAATRRAEGTVVMSATPATMVLDCVPEDNTLLVHRLAAGPPDVAKVVQK